MIIEKIVEVFLGIAEWLLNFLPDLNFELPVGFMEIIGNIFYGVNYFVPLNQVLPILVISFGITGFRIVWATVLRIKSFIPAMGG
jgi:hypothetical protein